MVPQPVLWEEQRIQSTDTIIDLRPIVAGTAALILGVLVYLTVRNPDALLLFQGMGLDTFRYEPTGLFFVPFWGVLPDFLHAFAFALITAGALGRNPSTHAPVCLFWFVINTVFELGQKFPGQAMALIPDAWMSATPIQWASVYVNKGTFDPFDILAFAAGSIAAFALLSVMNKKE